VGIFVSGGEASTLGPSPPFPGAGVAGTVGIPDAGFPPFGRGLRSGRLLTTLHAGLAGGMSSFSPSSGGGSSFGSSGIGGFQWGAYSPPAPCLDLTLISSAISYCNILLSSLNFPTSANNTRTSDAIALEKSFKYLGAGPL